MASKRFISRRSLLTGAGATLVSDASWQALFPFRIGYPKVEAKLSPRRAIQDVML